MVRVMFWLAIFQMLVLGGTAWGQEGKYPLMEMIAQRVVQKYQTSSCQDLAAKKKQKPAGKQAQIEARAIDLLRQDPQMRREFLNRVAGPIAEKMFECGMIP